jgi:hypothetical protein
VEPATENPLFNLPNVVCTPHLGAATTEAQENVALQVAEQMSDYLLTGAVRTRSTCRRSPPKRPRSWAPGSSWPSHLGAFIGQMTDEPIKAINILYDGVAAEMNLDALNCAVIAGIMKPAVNPEVNMVSAPVIAKERGDQDLHHHAGQVRRLRRLHQAHRGHRQARAVHRGTVFRDGKPRFIQIKGINIDAEIGQHMLYTTNKDVPGIIGALGADHGRERREHRQLHPGPRRGGRRGHRAAGRSATSPWPRHQHRAEGHVPQPRRGHGGRRARHDTGDEREPALRVRRAGHRLGDPIAGAGRRRIRAWPAGPKA